nr:MAG TPA: Prokaryotic membrane lipoprotein lipid attachment site [Caudoviricetes sp.]
MRSRGYRELKDNPATHVLFTIGFILSGCKD